MSRARYLKPTFFTNERIGELAPLERLAWQGLWCQADRDGRLKDRPKSLKIEILPYDDCDFEAILGSLEAAGFIVRYEVDSERYIGIPSFPEHQSPHYKEPASIIPPPTSLTSRIKQRRVKDEATSAQPSGNLPATSHLIENGLITESESEGTTTVAVKVSDHDPAMQRSMAALSKAGIKVNAFVAEDVGAMLDEGTKAEWVEAAVAIAARNGVASWNYVRSVLTGWGSGGPPKREPERAAQQPSPQQRTASPRVVIPPVMTQEEAEADAKATRERTEAAMRAARGPA